MKRTLSGWCLAVIGIVVCISFLPGCDKEEGADLSLKHKTLIAEFETFKTKQCACTDFDCTKALGQEIGPRVQLVMSDAKKLPPEVQLKLGAILAEMTECAKRTQQP